MLEKPYHDERAYGGPPRETKAAGLWSRPAVFPLRYRRIARTWLKKHLIGWLVEIRLHLPADMRLR